MVGFDWIVFLAVVGLDGDTRLRSVSEDFEATGDRIVRFDWAVCLGVIGFDWATCLGEVRFDWAV